jgi:hypothetical protein
VCEGERERGVEQREETVVRVGIHCSCNVEERTSTVQTIGGKSARVGQRGRKGGGWGGWGATPAPDETGEQLGGEVK